MDTISKKTYWPYSGHTNTCMCMWKKFRHTQCENNLGFNGQINTHMMWNALKALKIISLVYSTIDDQY
jgi:hypothetical protein